MKTLIFVIAALLCTCSNVFSQEKIFMPFFEAINLSSAERYGASKLLKAYADESGKYILMLPETKDTARHYTFAEALSEARVANASYLLLGELNRMGEVITVSLALYGTADGKLMEQANRRALSYNDLDKVLELMGKGLSVLFAEQPKDIYSVTKYEEQELHKTGVNYSFGFKVGGGYSFGSNINNHVPAGFGILGSYDAKNIIYNLSAEMFTSDISLYHISLDIMKTLNSLDNSGYFSAGLAYGASNALRQVPNYTDDDINYEGKGLAMIITGGYMFSRCSQVGFRVGVSAYIPFYQMDWIHIYNTNPQTPKSFYTPALLVTMVLTIGGKK